jgi:hypothetical protein
VKTIGKLAVVVALALLATAAGAELTLLSLARRGDAEAQYLVGMAYTEGREVPRDPAQGIRWLRHAASQRHAEARFALATLYREGRGVPQNLPAAVRLFRTFPPPSACSPKGRPSSIGSRSSRWRRCTARARAWPGTTTWR